MAKMLAEAQKELLLDQDRSSQPDTIEVTLEGIVHTIMMLREDIDKLEARLAKLENKT